MNERNTALEEAAVHFESCEPDLLGHEWMFDTSEIAKQLREMKSLTRVCSSDTSLACIVCRHEGIDWQCPQCGVKGMSEKSLIAALTKPDTSLSLNFDILNEHLSLAIAQWMMSLPVAISHAERQALHMDVLKAIEVAKI